MERYKVLYVDEEKIWRDHFTRYVHKEFDVDVIEPPEDPEALLQYIQESSAHAVVLDHLLSETMPEITYDGVDIVNLLKQRNARYPMFVLTSHDVKAMEEAEDVNYIYPKSVISEKEKQVDGKGEFNDRIRLQIKHYFDAIESAEKEFHALLNKADKEPLNGEEEERLIELDTFLNEQIGLDLDIPEHLKGDSSAELTLKLIQVSEELIEKISTNQEDTDA